MAADQQTDRIQRNRFIQASQGVNTCLPGDSGAQSISAGLITTCSTWSQVASVFALQTWKGICWLWGEVQTIQSDITAAYVAAIAASDAAITTAYTAAIAAAVAPINTAISAIRAQIGPAHVGTPTLSPLVGAGTGATASLVAGSTDLQGGILLTLGTGVAAGGANQMVQLIFGTAFAAPIFPTVSAQGGNSNGRIVNSTAGTSTPASIMISYWDPAAGLSNGQTVRIFYRIGFNS